MSESIEERVSALLAPFVTAEESFADRIAYEIKLDKHSRHFCCPQHEKTCLTYTFVGAPCSSDKLILSHGGEIDASGHISVLTEFEYYI